MCLFFISTFRRHMRPTNYKYTKDSKIFFLFLRKLTDGWRISDLKYSRR